MYKCDDCGNEFKVTYNGTKEPSPGKLVMYAGCPACGCGNYHIVDEGDKMRKFPTGATRDSEGEKYDYEGFLSPEVLQRYADYMHHHRKQADGKLRASDNWQKGIPIDVYMKSKWRHFMSTWLYHRSPRKDSISKAAIEESLCAELFNTMGMLFEILKEKK